ncbi:MAG: hypothetical protein Q9208_002784 [Pyrenodesmia sp. 3 TL-2023]
MASSEHMQTFSDILDGLCVLAGSLQALKGGQAMHADLQGVIEKNANHMELHYKRYLKDIEVPEAYRLRLEHLCQSLSSVHKAQKSVMVVIVGIMQHAHEEEPSRFAEQQNNIKLWHTMESEGIASQNMHTLLVEALLQRGSMVSATRISAVTERTVRREGLENRLLPQSVPTTDVTTTNLDQPTNSEGTIQAMTVLTRTRGAMAPTIDTHRAPIGGETASKPWFIRVNNIMILNQIYSDIRVGLVCDLGGDDIAEFYDPLPLQRASTLESESGIQINVSRISMPIHRSGTMTHVRLRYIKGWIDIRLKSSGDGEEFLWAFRDIYPYTWNYNAKSR